MQTQRTKKVNVEDIRRNPGKFIQDQVRIFSGEKPPQNLPAFFRKSQVLGVLEYDLPIKLITELTQEERTVLLGEIDKNLTRARGGARMALEKMKASLQSLDSSLQETGGKYKYRYDPLSTISQRKVQIRKRGPASKPVNKWIPLVTNTFLQAPAEVGVSLLDTMGFIPEEIYTKKIFREKVSFEQLARFHNNVLKPQQDSRESVCGVGDQFHRQRIMHSRSQLLKHLLLSGKAESAKSYKESKITIDTNGIWVNLVSDKSRIHSHIPFPYVNEDLCQYLETQEWLSAQDVREVRLQRAKVNYDVLEEEMEEGENRLGFSAACAEAFRGDSPLAESLNVAVEAEIKSSDCPGQEWASIAALIDTNHPVLGKAISEGKRIPSGVIKYYLDKYRGVSNGEDYDDSDLQKLRCFKVMSALEIAESVGSSISQSEMHKQLPRSLKSHALSQTARAMYEFQKNILNDPQYYEVAKIIGAVLNQGIPQNSSKNEFLVFRSNFGRKEAHSHSFLEIIHEGKVIRVLLAPDKHLHRKQRRSFSQISELPRADYEQLEAFAMGYHHFRQKLSDLNFLGLRAKAGANVSEAVPRISPQEIDECIKEINIFILTEFPEKYNEALQLYRHFFKEYAKPYAQEDRESVNKKLGQLKDFIRDYLNFCEPLQKKYAQGLFEAQNPGESLKRQRVNIRRSEVVFDDNFINDLPEREEKSWLYDPAISHSGRKIQVVEAGDRSIPYAMEAKAIRALRLLKDRPMINVAGGCRDTGYEAGGESPMEKMSRKILEVSHKYQANVAPPGTQSGLGAEMGRAYLKYQDQTDHLPPHERARFFAVSPGGETYYPDNSRLSIDPESEVYAIAPFDSIITPFDAGWNWSGARKSEAPYFQHVEYMEAIYERLGERQPRITIVGNGGLFTIVEVNAALKDDVPLILVEDTGRFADLAIALRRYFDSWDLLNEETKRGELDMKIIEIIEQYVPGEYKDRLWKDFGRAVPAENPEQEVYRVHLYEYLLLSRGKEVVVSSIEGVDGGIDGLIRGGG